MIELKLTQNKIALIDDEDFERVSQLSWQAHYQKGKWYVVSGSPYQMIYLHRFIMRPDSKIDIDHKDDDGLNNQRSNLRFATRSQNMANSGPRNGKKFKGIHKNSGRFRAQITVNYKRIHLGYFDTEEQAAKAYDEGARRYFGEYANTNF